MSEKRWYYTDPLAAAWMEDKFGMKFDPMPSSITYSFQHDDIYPQEHGVKYCIHPDSLHLLNPQVGDVVDLGHPIVCTITRFGEWKGNRIAESPDERSFHLSEIDAIIQRDGIPFMWPESEGA